MPGLDPTSVQRVRPSPDDLFDVAYLEDTQERRWVVKAPRTPVAGAMLEDVGEVSALLGHRLDLAIPIVRGHVRVPEGRAVVQPRLPGRPLDFAQLPGGLGLAGDVGRALAHIHNLEVALFEEAGRPAYDAEATRARRLVDLDRAAATGHVPTGLLARWEHSLEDVRLWRFLPTPVHGSFTGAHVLASFDDEDDAVRGRVSAILGWELAHVGDPAEDFADLAAQASPAALESVFEAYGPSRIDRPDPHLLARARLAAELAPLRRLLAATAADAADLVDRAAEELRLLEERVFAELELPAAASGPDSPEGREWVAGPMSEPVADAAAARAEAEREESADHIGGSVPLPAPASSAPSPSPADDAEADSPASVPASEIATVAVPVAAANGEASAAEKGEAVDPGLTSSPVEDEELDPGFTSSPLDGEPAQPPRLSAAHFELEEEEPPGAEAGILDLHEGASEFVAVEPKQRGPEGASGPD